MENSRFPDRLRRVVNECGLSVPRLAELAGLSKPTVYAIIDGHQPRAATVAALERAFAHIAGILAEAEVQPQVKQGVDDLAADHALLASLGATAAGDVARVRELLGTREGALVVLAAVLAGRE